MINSPIKSHYTDSSPERQDTRYNPGVHNGGITEPSMIKPN